jgi:hypothetical protein
MGKVWIRFLVNIYTGNHKLEKEMRTPRLHLMQPLVCVCQGIIGNVLIDGINFFKNVVTTFK